MKDKLSLTNEQVTEIVKKRKRNRPDLANFGEEYIEPGDNSKYLSFAMQFFSLPALDFNNVESVKERLQFYFTRCAEEDMKPSVAGMAPALGVDRRTLWEWKTGGRRETTSGLADTIKKGYQICELLWNDYMLNGKVNPASGIFIGKNYLDMKDQTDVIVTPNNPLQNLDEESARKRIIDALPEPDETE